jgi:hypothetical protein
MKTRIEKYHKNSNLKRTQKNDHLYEKLYEIDSTPVEVELLDNVKEIDISKIKEMIDNREEYKSMQKYRQIVKTEDAETEPTYDIYEDIENKMYDINNILEKAKSKRDPENEAGKKLRNTQYNILSKLDLNEAIKEQEEDAEIEEMVTDFFTHSGDLSKIIEKEDEIEVDKSGDLFSSLKSNNENTVLTEPIKNEQIKNKEAKDEAELMKDNSFYTNVHSFVKEDFEELQHLQGVVKKNNKLIKIMITILIISIIVLLVLFAINIFDLI